MSNKNNSYNSCGGDLIGVIQILLILGKIMDVPYVNNLSWWQIFIPVYAYFGVLVFAAIVTAFIFAFIKE